MPVYKVNSGEEFEEEAQQLPKAGRKVLRWIDILAEHGKLASDFEVSLPHLQELAMALNNDPDTVAYGIDHLLSLEMIEINPLTDSVFGFTPKLKARYEAVTTG